MAGVNIRVELVGEDEVSRALRRLADLRASLDEPLAEIGEALLISHKERFREERGPDGRPWEPLSEIYAARKAAKRPGRSILAYDDLLRGWLRYRVTGDELQLGTDRPYGLRHQEGFDGTDSAGRTIRTPARPWLGLSDDDVDSVLGIIRDYIEDQLAGRPARCEDGESAP